MEDPREHKLYQIKNKPNKLYEYGEIKHHFNSWQDFTSNRTVESILCWVWDIPMDEEKNDYWLNLYNNLQDEEKQLYDEDRDEFIENYENINGIFQPNFRHVLTLIYLFNWNADTVHILVNKEDEPEIAEFILDYQYIPSILY